MTGEVSFVMGKAFRYIPWTFVVAFWMLAAEIRLKECETVVPRYQYIEGVRVVCA